MKISLEGDYEKCSGRQSDNESHPANQTSSGRSPNQSEAIPFTNRFSVSHRSISVLLDKYCTPSAASDCIRRSYPPHSRRSRVATLRVNEAVHRVKSLNRNTTLPNDFRAFGTRATQFPSLLQENMDEGHVSGVLWRHHFASVSMLG